MENLLWFLMGVICANILTRLMAFGRMGLFTENVSNQCLKLLGAVHEDVAFIKQMKERMLVEMGTPENEIKIQVNIDDYALRSWRRASVNNFISGYPRQFRTNIGFYDWSTAMQKLNKLYENEKK